MARLANEYLRYIVLVSFDNVDTKNFLMHFKTFVTTQKSFNTASLPFLVMNAALQCSELYSSLGNLIAEY